MSEDEDRSVSNDILYTQCHILSHRQVEDEYVGGAPHRLVEDDNEDDQEVPDEPDDDHQGEDDGHLDTEIMVTNIDTKLCWLWNMI